MLGTNFLTDCLKPERFASAVYGAVPDLNLPF